MSVADLADSNPSKQLPPRELLSNLAYRMIQQHLEGENFVLNVHEIPLLMAAIGLVEPVEQLYVRQQQLLDFIKETYEYEHVSEQWMARTRQLQIDLEDDD